MRADEYDELLRDPADFTIRKLMPRNASTLEPLSMLPPVHWFSSGYSILKLLPIFCGLPPFAQLLEKLHRIGEEMNKWNAAHARLSQDLTEMGCPPLYGAKTVVPFDWISDMLRGMRGSMLDMYRQPDKLKAAIELFTPFTIESAIMAARQLNNPRVVIPLHRGAAGFMSNQQFAEFYWPSLKSMCLSFIDAGLVPMPIFEGDYTPRLEFLAELPKGKVLGHFDVVDRKKARQMIGDTMCFWGNVPSSLLIAGRPEQVRDDVKELIDTFADNGGLIIEGSAGIPDEAKPENVEAMIETVFEYGVYK
jgi:uroporphyrinogen-III decarboxylase